MSGEINTSELVGGQMTIPFHEQLAVADVPPRVCVVHPFLFRCGRSALAPDAPADLSVPSLPAPVVCGPLPHVPVVSAPVLVVAPRPTQKEHIRREQNYTRVQDSNRTR